MKPKEPGNASPGSEPNQPNGGLQVLDGYVPRTVPPNGHAILYLCTPEHRVRRVVGPVVEEFHDAVWHNPRRSTRIEITLAAPSLDPHHRDEPA